MSSTTVRGNYPSVNTSFDPPYFSPDTTFKVVSNKELWRPNLFASACTCVHAGTIHQSVYVPVHTPYINAYVIQNKLVLS
jgi:hypothetical protein